LSAGVVNAAFLVRGVVREGVAYGDERFAAVWECLEELKIEAKP
jgi:hypothetical protein